MGIFKILKDFELLREAVPRICLFVIAYDPKFTTTRTLFYFS